MRDTNPLHDVHHIDSAPDADDDAGAKVATTNKHGARIELGANVLDPLDRVATIIELLPQQMVRVRMRSPFGGTASYAADTLRPAP